MEQGLERDVESIVEQEVDALLLRGRALYGASNLGEAMNAFNAVLVLDVSNEEALQMKQIIGDIIEFRSTDMYNP